MQVARPRGQHDSLLPQAVEKPHFRFSGRSLVLAGDHIEMPAQVDEKAEAGVAGDKWHAVFSKKCRKVVVGGRDPATVLGHVAMPECIVLEQCSKEIG